MMNQPMEFPILTRIFGFVSRTGLLAEPATAIGWAMAISTLAARNWDLAHSIEPPKVLLGHVVASIQRTIP